MAGGVVTQITTSGTGAGTHLLSSTFYGTCATGASTAAKIVKLSDTNVNSATLKTGMLLTVKFTNTNTAASPTLTIQTSGGTQLIAAKSVMRYGTTAASTTEGTSWRAGAIVSFVYDGTNWVEISSIDDNSGGTVTSVSTGAGLTGGAVTTTGTIKANLNSETSLGTIGTTDNLYAVGVDSNNKLAVLVSGGGTSAIIRRWTTA